MATATSQEAPKPETCQSNFEQAVALSLHLWPALTFAVTENMGGGDSQDKRDWFAGAIVDLFPSFTDLAAAAEAPRSNQRAPKTPEEPDVEAVETVLLQVMFDEFEVNVDDDSGFEVANQITRLRVQCAEGKFDEVEALRTRWQNSKGSKVVFKKAEDPDQDTDWESDDDDEDDDDERDVDMDDAPPLVQGPRGKPPPEVDEDGFTKVSRNKR